MPRTPLTRRAFVASAAAGLTLPATNLHAETVPATARRNVSGFRPVDWRDHFDDLGKATIIADTISRALHFWSGDGADYRLYPTSVPRTEDLTRRGFTKVVRKKVGPSWTPTASMRAEDPTLPTFMEPGPGNPLGTHAMYLDWPAYLIHGTHDTRKIGRRSSSGCIGLYNEKIEELFAVTPIGTQVRLI